MIGHLLTFAGKARHRGWGYVRAVSEYHARRTQYQLQTRYGDFARKEEFSALDLAEPSAYLTESSFHFGARDIPRIVASVPDALKSRTLDEADNLCGQRFTFRGLEELWFEGKVDWDARPEGNLSWNWDLNRHRYFLTLATAHYYNHDPVYLRKLVELWSNWIEQNPPGQVRNWQYPFEVAARLQNWVWAYFLLAYSGRGRPTLLRHLAGSLYHHAQYVASHLEYHWPNNHLLLEAKALYEFALLFPQFDNSAMYLRRAGRLLEQEVATQVLADGGHSELCSMYHCIVAGELGELVLLGWKTGRPLPLATEQRITRMMEFWRVLRRDDGSMPLLGDSSDGDTYRRFDFARRTSCDLNYWLWQAPPPKPQSQVQGDGAELRLFPDAGYAFLHAGQGESEVHLTFDFGPFSQCAAANHGHSDALSFELYAEGRPLIVDPGFYFPWRDGGDWPRYFRSTRAHNTLMVDGHEQSEFSDSWHVGRSAKTRLVEQNVRADEASVCGESVPAWAEGSGLSHRRRIRRRSDGQVVIHDRVSGDGKHRLEWFFHFAADLEVQKDTNGGVTAYTGKGADLVSLSASAPIAPGLSLVKGRRDPLQGWVASTSAKVSAAWVAVYAAEVELPFEIEFRLQLAGRRRP